ncbi:MAG: hypothetical protein DCC71_07050 [Proteobacteria bacterium]|nr:MAG: hypothetical protein DCC71_07050 [Pseudomonadota bacterium]
MSALGVSLSFFWVWTGAALLYAAFRVWYDNWRGALRPDEIERFLAALPGTPGAGGNDADTLRRFLEADDGREFWMLNLVRLASGDVPHPRTGAPTRAAALMREYVRGFLPVLIRHGGHPVLQARKIGGYVDAWNVPPDPGWSLVGVMRYRSRRDMVELASDPRFTAAHPFKFAAIPVTASFPTAPGLALLLGPRVWVALVLALGAALLT